MALSGKEKATILLSILGADLAAPILDRLPGDLADILLSSSGNIPKPTPETIARVITEFREFVSLPAPPKRPAIEGGPAQSERKEGGGSPKDILSRVPGRVLIPILLRERPQTIAFVLKGLPESRVTEVLTYLPEQRREVEYLLNNIKQNPLMDEIRDDVLQYVSSKLS